MTMPPDLRRLTPLTPEAHRAWVEQRFRRYAPTLADLAWDRGLVMLHALTPSGGVDAQISIHRASCPIVAVLAVAPERSTPIPVLPVQKPDDVRDSHARCPDCGTDNLPDGALLWGDTQREVDGREAENRMVRRTAAYRAAQQQVPTLARQRAEQEILAQHATEVTDLTARYARDQLDALDDHYPDVVIHLLTRGEDGPPASAE